MWEARGRARPIGPAKERRQMTQESAGGGAPLDHTRQVTIDALCEHFANDVMSVEEFERRVDTAHKASTSQELKNLLADLPTGDLPAVVDQDTRPARADGHALASSRVVKERSYVVAVCGGTTRRGRWAPARRNFSIAVCGGAELDFREAVMPPGVTEVQVYTMWGGVEVIVPPGMNVESHGVGLLGAFEHMADSAAPDPNGPTLRITGLALMGGVEVSVRHAGETARDARRRRKAERREKRRRLRS